MVLEEGLDGIISFCKTYPSWVWLRVLRKICVTRHRRKLLDERMCDGFEQASQACRGGNCHGGVFGKWTHRVDDRRLIGCDSSEQVLVQAERCRWRMVLPGQ